MIAAELTIRKAFLPLKTIARFAEKVIKSGGFPETLDCFQKAVYDTIAATLEQLARLAPLFAEGGDGFDLLVRRPGVDPGFIEIGSDFEGGESGDIVIDGHASGTLLGGTGRDPLDFGNAEEDVAIDFVAKDMIKLTGFDYVIIDAAECATFDVTTDASVTIDFDSSSDITSTPQAARCPACRRDFRPGW